MHSNFGQCGRMATRSDQNVNISTTKRAMLILVNVNRKTQADYLLLWSSVSLIAGKDQTDHRQEAYRFAAV